MVSPDLPAAVAAWLDDATLVSGADAIDAAVRSMSPDDVVGLAAAVRAGARSFHWRWGMLDRATAGRRLDRAPRLGPAALLTVHRNGFVRQAGLDALSRETDEAALAFFVLRLDDIVPQLRELARAAIEERLRPPAAEAWAKLLPLVGRLARRSRAGASATLRAIEAFLLSPAARPALSAASGSADVAVRRAATVLLVRCGELGEGALAVLEAALRDPDATLVRWAAVEVTSTRAADAIRRALVPALVRNRDPAVRRRAVLSLARDGAMEELERALFDPRAAIRLLVREKLRGPGSHALYVAALSRPAPSRRELLGALGGLAEVGTPADAALAAPHLASPDSRVRAEAVRCVGALDPGRYRGDLEEAAASPLRRVRLEAVRALAGGRRGS